MTKEENATCYKCGAGIWTIFHSPVNGKYFCSNHFKEENLKRTLQIKELEEMKVIDSLTSVREQAKLFRKMGFKI